MEELGIPELTTKQIELLCQTAESAAKKYVLSKISLKLVDKLNIFVEAIGGKPVTVKITQKILDRTRTIREFMERLRQATVRI